MSLAASGFFHSKSKAADAAEDRSIVLSDGRRLGFAEFGAQRGIPVFGFHGTPGSRLMFRLVHEPALRLGIRLIAPDRPGFGRSTYQHGRAISDWADDVRALADELQLERFGVAGISGGGPYAAACAALLPDRIAAAALISPVGPVQPPEGPEAIGPAQYVTFRLLHRLSPAMRGAFTAGRLMFLNAPNSMYRLIMSRAARADRLILARPDIRKNLIEGIAEGLRPGIQGALQEMTIFGRPWNLPFEAIKAPALLWQGTADRNVPVAAALHLARLIPGCELFRIEGAGHYWIFEHMEEVLKATVQKMSAMH
jgi:pimeloyl-ACP methyl ester carboxylesterase